MQSGSSSPTFVFKTGQMMRSATVPLFSSLSAMHTTVNLRTSRLHPRRRMQTTRRLAVLSLQVRLPPPPLPRWGARAPMAGVGPLTQRCWHITYCYAIGARTDWEASLASFTPPGPTASPATTVSEQQRTSSPSQSHLRSERGRHFDHNPEVDIVSEQSEDEADPVPTPLSDIAFEGAHVIEFTELTASNSRIQLENFVEQFRGVGLAPPIRCAAHIALQQACPCKSLSAVAAA